MLPARRPSRPRWSSSPQHAPPSAPGAVVLNGDVFDFLAQAGLHGHTGGEQGFFDELAARWVHEILDSYPAVKAALGAVLARPGGTLVIVGGNHDVELAMPRVQQALRAALGAAEAPGRLHFATDGAGYRATVGGRSILCTHGERGDGWNAVGPRHRAQAGPRPARGPQRRPPGCPHRAMPSCWSCSTPSRRTTPSPTSSSPKTTWVVALYRWIIPDIDPRRGTLISKSLRASVRKSFRLRFLSQEGEAPEALAVPRPASTPAAQVLTDLNEELDPLDLVDGDGQLGTAGKLWQLARPNNPTKLVEALRSYAEDQKELGLASDDDTSKWVDGQVSPRVDFVVCGHTHQRKSIRRSQGGGHYFNTGTWIPLLLLEHDDLSEDRVEQLRKDLQSGDRARLEPYLHRRGTLARFGGPRGRLRGRAAGGSPRQRRAHTARTGPGDAPMKPALDMQQVRLEIVRSGPPHNQLLSPPDPLRGPLWRPPARRPPRAVGAPAVGGVCSRACATPKTSPSASAPGTWTRCRPR